MLIKVLSLIEATYEGVGKPVEDGSVGDLAAQMSAVRLNNVLGRGLLQAEMPLDCIQHTVVSLAHHVEKDGPSELLRMLLQLVHTVLAKEQLPLTVSLLASALGRALRFDEASEEERAELTKAAEAILAEYKTIDLNRDKGRGGPHGSTS